MGDCCVQNSEARDRPRRSRLVASGETIGLLREVVFQEIWLGPKRRRFFGPKRRRRVGDKYPAHGLKATNPIAVSTLRRRDAEDGIEQR
jgi:hypothetical protein